MSGGQEQVQTLGEAKTTIFTSIQSSFASLAKMLGISQLKESFYQNIIYIFIVIVIMVGILVYIQIVGAESNNPLFAPPTKEVKKVEIKKIVEGFDTETDFGSTDIGSAADVSDNVNTNDEHDLHDLHDGYHEHVNNKRK
jgi:hypothetical protein